MLVPFKFFPLFIFGVIIALLHNAFATTQCVRYYWQQNKCTTILGCVPKILGGMRHLLRATHG